MLGKEHRKKTLGGRLVRNLKCKDFSLTLPSFATKYSSSNYACYNVYSFFGAYFLLLSFYCHFLPARNKRKIELIPKEKEENLLAQGNRDFSIILLVYIFTVNLVYVVLSKGWQP